MTIHCSVCLKDGKEHHLKMFRYTCVIRVAEEWNESSDAKDGEDLSFRYASKINHLYCAGCTTNFTLDGIVLDFDPNDVITDGAKMVQKRMEDCRNGIAKEKASDKVPEEDLVGDPELLP